MMLDDKTLQEKLDKADRLLTLMRATKVKATAILGRDPESKFTALEELALWGWADNYDKDERGNDTKHFSITEKEKEFEDADFVKALGVSLKSSTVGLDSTSSTKFVSLEQSKPFELDGVECKETLGDFRNYFDPAAGFLGGYLNNSPTQMVHASRPKPELKHWSDVVYILWTHFSKIQEQQLEAPRHIVRIGITNTETDAVITHIKQTFDTPKNFKWPGFEFDIESQQGKLLLQTVNGKSAAWFLITHKEAFGVKSMERVRLWYPGKDTRYSLIFYVSDVPENKLVK